MGYVPEIPDIALDKHTTRGQEMGRGSEHFYMKQVKLSRKQKVENDYKEQYEEIIKKYDPNHVVPSTFVLILGKYKGNTYGKF